MKITQLVLPAFFIGSIIFSSCNNGTGDQAAEPGVLPDTVESTTPSVEIAPVGPQTEPAAGQYSRIKTVYKVNDTLFLDADYIRFLMGTEAGKAAQKEGDAEMAIGPNGDTTYSAPGGYYILPQGDGAHTLPVAPDVHIELTGQDGESISGTIDKLNTILTDGVFVLTIQNGIVTRIKQQFIP